MIFEISSCLFPVSPLSLHSDNFASKYCVLHSYIICCQFYHTFNVAYFDVCRNWITLRVIFFLTCFVSLNNTFLNVIPILTYRYNPFIFTCIEQFSVYLCSVYLLYYCWKCCCLKLFSTKNKEIVRIIIILVQMCRIFSLIHFCLKLQSHGVWQFLNLSVFFNYFPRDPINLYFTIKELKNSLCSKISTNVF